MLTDQEIFDLGAAAMFIEIRDGSDRVAASLRHIAERAKSEPYRADDVRALWDAASQWSQLHDAVMAFPAATAWSRTESLQEDR